MLGGFTLLVWGGVGKEKAGLSCHRHAENLRVWWPEDSEALRYIKNPKMPQTDCLCGVFSLHRLLVFHEWVVLKGRLPLGFRFPGLPIPAQGWGPA